MEPQSQLLKINKNEYLAQQKSKLEDALEMGLTKDEYNLICKKINKIPNMTELGIFSAMFSEHCSYKSSKKWLKTLPTKAAHVIQGPGENAGVIDIGENLAAIFKIESHNHPSFIEPYLKHLQVYFFVELNTHFCLFLKVLILVPLLFNQ